MNDDTDVEGISDTVPAPCDCDAKLADITAAVIGQSERITALTESHNQLGAMIDQALTAVGQALQSLQSMGPASMLKGLISRGR